MKIFYKKLTYSIMFALFGFLILSGSLNAQDINFRQPAMRYGVNGALQINSASLGWQYLNNGIPSFHSDEDAINYVDGTGLGFYGGIFGEYLSESWWGVQMRISYDSRDALVDDITKTPNSSLDTKIRYLTFEPLFRVDQNLIPSLNFYAGPYLAVNLKSSFYYRSDKDMPDSEAEFNVENFNKVTYGAQAGIAYDIRFADINANSSMYVSPFFDASWIVNQKESDEQDQNAISDVWSTASYRLGVRLSLENRVPVEKTVDNTIYPQPVQKVLMVMPEGNQILTKNIKGYFPIHPYIFFEKGSQEIPPRYILLTKSQAMNFKESDLENFIKGDLTVKETNVDQLMITYYNSMNIFGDRMRNNPKEKLVLRGSDPEGADAAVAANNVKEYLVNIFGIDPDRIEIIIEPPLNPSGSIYSEEISKGLLADENRRVKFIFTNPEMSKPINYTIRDESSIDNDLVFSIGSTTPYTSWDITISGEGKTMYFGPYAYRAARINPAELMRFLESGNYVAKVVITDKEGNRSEEIYPFKLTKVRELQNASRYLMVFNYNDAGAVKSYEDKILKEIVPGIEPGNKVIIHGHTDNIGTDEGNYTLSQARADEVKGIIDGELKRENKTNIVNAVGVGQSLTPYTFNNRYPEGRMYNRNVFVEIIK